MRYTRNNSSRNGGAPKEARRATFTEGAEVAPIAKPKIKVARRASPSLRVVILTVLSSLFQNRASTTNSQIRSRSRGAGDVSEQAESKAKKGYVSLSSGMDFVTSVFYCARTD